MSRNIGRGLAVGAAAFAVAALVHSLGVFRPLEWKSWDLRLRLFSKPSEAGQEIVVLFVDQESLDVYEKEQNLPWPWPRQVYSAVVDYLKTGGAKAVFFDLILSETSRFGVEDDENFAASIKKSGNVFIPFFLSPDEKERDEQAVQALGRFALRGISPPEKAVLPLKSVLLPADAILRSSGGSGNVRFDPDRDSIFRRLPLLFSYEGLILPSLPFALAQYVKPDLSIEEIPLDPSGRMVIRYHGPCYRGQRGTYKTYSIASIINSWALIEQGKAPQVDPKEFSGRIVFVGTNAPGLLDLKPTPFSPVCSGTEIHAAAVDNLLKGDFIRVSPRGIVFLLTLAFSLLTAVGVFTLKKIWRIGLFFIFCLALPAGAASLAFLSGHWLEFVTPILAVVLSFIVAALLSYGIEGKQRRFIKTVFKHYLSPDVIERVLENPSLLRLGGEKREITVMFSDVAGFTAISEGLSPEDLVNLLNAYLTEMTDIILETGGTLDKYEGDAIIAFWNAPLDQPDHALRAFRAALRCQKRLSDLRPDFKARFGHEVHARIGLNSGPAVVGNMGSGKRFDYTAMGDTINLASRLEGACKQYGLPALIGEATQEMAGGAIVAREIDLIRVIGKKKPIRVFEPVGETQEVSSSDRERVDRFHKALDAYKRRDWRQALELFREMEPDALAETYISRCLGFIESPPPEDWDGVFVLKQK